MKAIYRPKGKANEYSQWAVNFYNGCSGKCSYCYNRKGRGAHLLGKEKPTIKKTLINEVNAITVFKSELQKYRNEIKKSEGLFFNFVSDPFLNDTATVNTIAIRECLNNDIPVVILTKQTMVLQLMAAEIQTNGTLFNSMLKPHMIKIGFTLTGHDEMEQGCCTNAERIETMKLLHEIGIKTWASIEPIVDFDSSLNMIHKSLPYCQHYKIGLMSGKTYKLADLRNFHRIVGKNIIAANKVAKKDGRFSDRTVYWKQSLLSKINNGEH